MMKKYFYLLALVCATSFFTACSNDDDDNTPKYETITFEGSNWDALIDNAQYGGKLLYGESGYGFSEENGAYEWTDATTSLHSKINGVDYGYSSGMSWSYSNGGAAVSNYSGKIEGSDYKSQLAIPTGLAPHSGTNFLMIYGYGEHPATFDFKDGKAHTMKGLWITNGTYFLNVMANGNGFCAKATSTTKISVVFEGFKADGTTTTSTGTVKYTVQDGTTSLKDWKYVDLSSLGEISSLKVNYEASDDMKGQYGYNAPAYIAVDDVEIYK